MWIHWGLWVCRTDYSSLTYAWAWGANNSISRTFHSFHLQSYILGGHPGDVALFLVTVCFQVRAAAITTLAKFGASCQKLRSCVEVLLKRCLLDSDDEVRDRATFYLGLMRNGQPKALSNYILDALKVSICGIIVVVDTFSVAGFWRGTREGSESICDRQELRQAFWSERSSCYIGISHHSRAS